jgi:sugar phosphate isomerase/epimerase
MTSQNRRAFLTTLGAATVGAFTAPGLLLGGGAGTTVPRTGKGGAAAAGLSHPGGQPQPRKLERFGLQLYTLRSATRADMAGTLEKVAQAGYKEVEFAGYQTTVAGQVRTLTPAEVGALLTRFALTSPSTHVGLSNNADSWKAAVDSAKLIGHEFITVPSLPGGFDRNTQDGWKALADRFNIAAAVARSAGLRFAFHNHDAEFRDVQGTTGFDLLLAHTDPALVSFQIDLYWMTRGGRDALDYYTKHPTRFPMLHVKDSAGPPDHRMVDVGKGVIPFGAIFARAVNQGTKHFFVEHDNPADPMDSMRVSAEYLTRLEF